MTRKRRTKRSPARSARSTGAGGGALAPNGDHGRAGGDAGIAAQPRVRERHSSRRGGHRRISRGRPADPPARRGRGGAHPRQWVRPPDWDEFRSWQDATGGQCPHRDAGAGMAGGAGLYREDYRRWRGGGHRAYAGHEGADQANAVSAGATLWTHHGQWRALCPPAGIRTTSGTRWRRTG